MTEKRVIEAVNTGVVGETKIWTVIFSRPGGATGAHIFPEDTLLWRSIEYGVDINDVDALLDVILHEPFIADPTDPANYESDPAAKAGHTVREAGTKDPIFGTLTDVESVPVWLYNAPNVDTAWTAHLIRIENAKNNKVKYIEHTGKGTDPLDVIRNSHRDVLMLIDHVPEVRAIYGSMHAHIADNREHMRLNGLTEKTKQYARWVQTDNTKGARNGMA